MTGQTVSYWRMCSQTDYCFLAGLTVFPVDEDGLSLHVIASQKQRAPPLFVLLEFCLSSFGFSISKERAFVPKHCHSTLYQRSWIFRFPPALHPTLVSQSQQDIFVLFQRLTTYSSQTCFIFRFNCHLNQITLTEAVLCSCQDAVSFINGVFNHGPPGGLCYSNASRIILHQQSRIII